MMKANGLGGQIGQGFRRQAQSLLLAPFFLISIAAAPAPTPTPNPDPVRARIEPIVSRFAARMKACGRDLAYVPAVVVDSRPTLISFYLEDRSLHASRWSAMPSEIQGMIGAWAGQGTLGLSPEGQFGEIFNSLLVPHELGHYAASLNGRAKGQSFWDGEVYANRVALAFWKGEPGADRLAARLGNYNRFLEALPNPVPAGQQPRAYFEANYEALGSNPQAYGWYQGLFMREAMAAGAADDFCTITAPVAPSPAAPSPK